MVALSASKLGRPLTSAMAVKALGLSKTNPGTLLVDRHSSSILGLEESTIVASLTSVAKLVSLTPEG